MKFKISPKEQFDFSLQNEVYIFKLSWLQKLQQLKII